MQSCQYVALTQLQQPLSPFRRLTRAAPYFPETPWGFRDTLFASATTERLAILASGVPQRLVNFLRRDLPMCDIPSLLRLLRHTLLEHQFQTVVVVVY